MLSPSLFNAYLDAVINENEFLKKLSENGQLIAFADDLFIIANNYSQAEQAIKAVELLENYGLQINLKKTQIKSDREDMTDVDKILDIKVTDSINYLGIHLYCDRLKLLASVKAQVKKYMGYLKLRIRSNNYDLVRVIFSAFYRSMLIYYLHPSTQQEP